MQLLSDPPAFPRPGWETYSQPGLCGVGKTLKERREHVESNARGTIPSVATSLATAGTGKTGVQKRTS